MWGQYLEHASCLFYRANWTINLPELQFEARFLWILVCREHKFLEEISEEHVHHGDCISEAYV